MKLRKINRMVKSTPVNMGGFKVEQPLPNFGMQQMDPFLLIHHAKHDNPGDRRPSESGVGPHPHRGFSPVTFVFQGDVHHRDSRGNNQIVGEGGMQWMSAGMGIIHSERPSKDFAAKGGESEIVQIWVNTPMAHKMDQPYYLPIHLKDAPRIYNKEETAFLTLYAGEYNDQSGPARVPFPLQLMRLDMEKGSSFNLDTEQDQNLLIYQLNGLSEINNRESGKKKMTVFETGDGGVEIKTSEKAQFIILSGRPLDEPVSSQGPFVMNTQTELLEAMRDYQMGKMGMIVEEFD